MVSDKTFKLTLQTLIGWQIFKWSIVLLLIGYLIVMLYLYWKTGTIDTEERTKLQFTNQILFGNSGILWYIFLLIVFSILILIALPLLHHLYHEYEPHLK